MATANVNGVRLFLRDQRDEERSPGPRPRLMELACLLAARRSEVGRVFTGFSPTTAAVTAPASARQVKAAFMTTWRTSQRSSNTCNSGRRGLPVTRSAGPSRFGWQPSVPTSCAGSSRTSHRFSLCLRMIPPWRQFSGRSASGSAQLSAASLRRDHAGAAEQFVETVAIGPGAWAQFPPEARQVMIENAPTFLDEAHDPEQLAFDLGRITAFSKPVLLTTGGTARRCSLRWSQE